MWNLFVDFMLYLMLLLYQAVGNNFIIAIGIFTVVMRLLLLPLTFRQQRSSMRMQEIQPDIQRIQKKYRDNPQKMQEEFQKIGYNPAEPLLGCLPLFLQMPIWIALLQVLRLMTASSPLAMLEMQQRVQAFPLSASLNLNALLPVDNTFLWFNLGQPDPLLILPIVVTATMFLSQRLMMPAKKADDGKKKGKKEDENPAAQMTQSMQYTMPLMFGFFALQYEAGLSVYFIISNFMSIVQGFVVRRNMDRLKAEAAASFPKRTAVDDEDDSADESAEKVPEPSVNGAATNGSGGSTAKKKGKATSSSGGSRRKKKKNRR